MSTCYDKNVNDTGNSERLKKKFKNRKYMYININSSKNETSDVFEEYESISSNELDNKEQERDAMGEHEKKIGGNLYKKKRKY